MSIINTFFDQVYLINLDRRRDRLEIVTQECETHDIQFKRINAIDGNFYTDYVKYDAATTQSLRWTSGAAALVKTTQGILEEAIKNNFQRILIMEDDITFHPEINTLFKESIQHLPEEWETFYLGLIHQQPYEKISRYLAKVSAGYCCHCYAINSRFFEQMHQMISRLEKPIDQYTIDDIQSRGKSYCVTPNLAFQRTDYSDIGNECVQHRGLHINYDQYFGLQDKLGVC